MRHSCLANALATIGLLMSAASSAAAREYAPECFKAAPTPEKATPFELENGPARCSTHVLTGVGFGAGLRFNNPYRLATQFGPTGESLSATAPYMMLTAAVTYGAPDGLQHGAFASLSVALLGIGQAVFTPGYMMLYRGPSRLLGYARVGPAIVLSPQTNVGGEVALGGAFFLTGSLGISFDLAGNIFYGASTWEKKYPTYPVLSATAGLIVDFEVLP